MGLNQNSSEFDGVWTLASAHALHLPTNTVQIFQVKLNFRLWGKSEASLCRGEHSVVMKLGVQPLELAFRVDSQDSKGEVLEYKVYGWCNCTS